MNKLIAIACIFLQLAVCNAFLLDWFLPAGKETEVEAEAKMSVPELIRHAGYDCENHEVTTKDGYVLTLHRIPRGHLVKSNATHHGTPIFLQHGLIASSSNWIENIPEKSLGFILADAGYDVWLGNSRGNTYSKKHKTLSIDSVRYWDFSWQEMALADLPACIDYVLKKTGFPSLYYAGHSQGTLIAFTAFSELPELAKKIKMFFALAPVSTLRYLSSSVINNLQKIQSVVEPLFGHKEFPPASDILTPVLESTCSSVGQAICKNVLFAIAGYNEKGLNLTRLPIYLHHTPSTTSVKDIIHFSQIAKSGQMEAYNYRDIYANMRHYNSITPPQYHVEKMNTTTILLHGGKDPLADPRDVEQLIKKIKNLEKVYYEPSFSHMDYIWGITADVSVYAPMLRHMEKNRLGL